jgi:creatinine amidohydrolase
MLWHGGRDCKGTLTQEDSQMGTRSWHWEELTAGDFSRAVEDTQGVCIVPWGCIEKHGGQLPLGTDSLLGQALAEEAAAIEPVVIYPFFYFGLINTALPHPGTIAYSSRLLFDVLEETCSEIARNGMHKIILMQNHGGNTSIMQFFLRARLEKEYDYTLYTMDLACIGEWSDFVDTIRESPFDNHGGEVETSKCMHACPELVKMDQLDPDSGADQNRLAALRAGPGGAPGTSVDWYSSFPDHYAGDASPSTPEKGAKLMNRQAECVADVIRKIKADEVTPELLREFHSRRQH